MFGGVEDDQRYTRLVELFADDAVYYDPFFGPQVGKAARSPSSWQHMESKPCPHREFDVCAVDSDGGSMTGQQLRIRRVASWS